MTRKLVNRIASAMAAIENCRKSGNTEWERKHAETINDLVRNYMPSGSGIDSGTSFDVATSTGEKLVFFTSYHHMNDVGMYDGWTEHTVTVRPSFVYGLDIKISGRDRNEIKEYLHQCFYDALQQEYSDEQLAA